jgi:hypothetical protein
MAARMWPSCHGTSLRGAAACGAAGSFDDANSLVMIADEHEYHLHAFLESK